MTKKLSNPNTYVTDSGITVIGVDPRRIERAQAVIDAAEKKYAELSAIKSELEEQLGDPDPRVAALAQLALTGAITHVFPERETVSTGVAIQRLQAQQNTVEKQMARIEELQRTTPGSAVAAAEALIDLVSEYPDVALFACAAEAPSELTGNRLVVTSLGVKTFAGSNAQAEDILIEFVGPSYVQPLSPAVVQDALSNSGFGFMRLGERPSPLAGTNGIEEATSNVSRNGSELHQRISWTSGTRYSPKELGAAQDAAERRRKEKIQAVREGDWMTASQI